MTNQQENDFVDDLLDVNSPTPNPTQSNLLNAGGNEREVDGDANDSQVEIEEIQTGNPSTSAPFDRKKFFIDATHRSIFDVTEMTMS